MPLDPVDGPPARARPSGRPGEGRDGAPAGPMADRGRPVVDAPLGTGLPEGVRFIGAEPGALPAWPFPDPPDPADIASCVACGLCLPHCPTYRLTGEESASPRGRIAAMRAVSEGRAEVDATFTGYMDLCLACRACEHACPGHVPFGRLMEHARAQVEPLRPPRQRFARWLGIEVVLARGWLVTLVTALLGPARPLLPRRLRALAPRVRPGELLRRLPRVTEPDGPVRGTVLLLAGCVQDRWYRPANRATIAVLARNGWRVVVPPGQGCCGALAAHHGRPAAARRLARRNLAAFAGAGSRSRTRAAGWLAAAARLRRRIGSFEDKEAWQRYVTGSLVVVNAAGCSAHMKEYGQLLGDEAGDLPARVRDLMELLDRQELEPPGAAPFGTVAVHDPCHLLHAQGIADAPRRVLGQVPGLRLAELADGDRCCGAAGLYGVLQPEMAGELQAQKAAAIAATGAPAVAVANPGCAVQIAAGLAARGADVEVLHPAELLERAYRRAADGRHHRG
ncbi:MAG TPA: (Fe-S)-binding protein [Actinomycetota bacterium]